MIYELIGILLFYALLIIETSIFFGFNMGMVTVLICFVHFNGSVIIID